VIVLDTHVWLWHVDQDDRALSRAARSALHEGADLVVCAISVWEVGMLVAKGRLRVGRPLDAWIRAALTPSGVRCVPVDAAIAARAAQIDDFHGDPADRLIVATAVEHGADLVTKDRAIRTWARRHRLSTIW
jgi:PIN domain nuclease of toxin-antitoxin system